MLKIDTWQDVFKLCFVFVVITSCAGGFMYVTASNPSADDFWRAVGITGGGVGTYLLGRHSGIKSVVEEN